MNQTEDVFHLGTKAIIRNAANEILVLKVENGMKNYWDLPGGRVQVDEDLPSTLRREVAEETGLTNLGDLTMLGMMLSKVRIKIGEQKTAGLVLAFYGVNVDASDIKLSGEHQAYSWISVAKAQALFNQAYGPLFAQQILSK